MNGVDLMFAVAIGVLVVMFLAAAGLALYDGLASTETKRELGVSDKFFSSEKTRTAVGPVVGEKGGVAVTLNHEPAEFLLQTEMGIKPTTESTFLHVERGKRYTFWVRRGGFGDVKKIWLVEGQIR